MEPRVLGRLAESRVYVAALAIAWLYFLSMDVAQYVRIRQSPVRGASSGSASAPAGGDEFSIFGDVAVKAIMEDHLTAYGVWPLAVHFELATGFSQMGRLVTPNAVSFTGAAVAVLAARLVASSSVAVRRAGVGVFLFRLWLDALDGVVFRRQHFVGMQAHHQMSVRGSSGYFVDAFCDFFTGICVLVAFYVFLVREPRPRHISLVPCSAASAALSTRLCSRLASATGWSRRGDGGGRGSSAAALPLLPLSSSSSPDASLAPGHGQQQQPQQATRYSVTMKLIVTALLMALSSATWDYFVSQYRTCLEVVYPDAARQNLQHDMLSSPLTYGVFFAWKMFNAVELMNMAFYAILLDKIWECVNLMQCAGVLCWIITVIVTKIHLTYVQSALSSVAATSTGN